MAESAGFTPALLVRYYELMTAFTDEWVHIQSTAGRMQRHFARTCAGQSEIFQIVIANPCLIVSFLEQKPKTCECYITAFTHAQRQETKTWKAYKIFNLASREAKNLQRVKQESYLGRCVQMLTGLCVCVCAAAVSRCLWEWPTTSIRLVLYHPPSMSHCGYACACVFPMKFL